MYDFKEDITTGNGIWKSSDYEFAFKRQPPEHIQNVAKCCSVVLKRHVLFDIPIPFLVNYYCLKYACNPKLVNAIIGNKIDNALRCKINQKHKS